MGLLQVIIGLYLTIRKKNQTGSLLSNLIRKSFICLVQKIIIRRRVFFSRSVVDSHQEVR